MIEESLKDDVKILYLEIKQYNMLPNKLRFATVDFHF